MAEENVKMVYESLINNLGQTGFNRIITALSMPPFSTGKIHRYANFLCRRIDGHCRSHEERIWRYLPLICIQKWSPRYRKPRHCCLIWWNFDEERPQVPHWCGICCRCWNWRGCGLRSPVKLLYSVWEKEEKTTLQEFDKWMQGHQQSCHKNYDGSAGALEAKAASRIWRHSEKHHLPYTIVGEGNSSAYNAVCALNDGQGQYDVPVLKEECINHVCKRMGTRLHKFKREDFTISTKTERQMKRSVLGGANMLTDNIIQKLQSYYQKAVRDSKNKTVASMRNDIMASYFHAFSSDEHPSLQKLCP